MRAALAAALVVIVAAVAALLVLGLRGEDGYRVRAIFDNAGFVIAGEDVRVAGVNVGQVDAVEVTPDLKAALVLRIDDAGYQDFRADARCKVRPQSLIGERYVECEPTQPRGVGAELPGPLRRIEDGPGAGQYLLPVENTEKAVDLDLINDIMRRPERERLSIILNELGVGLAGRGADLDAVIRRAAPALREVDAVLALLARQNDRLAALAADSDAVIAPLARERRRVASAIDNAGAVAQATAQRRAALEAGLRRLPRFLAELRPTMTRLGALAGEMTPVVDDLRAVAPDVNRFVSELGPFARAGVPALESLGAASRTGTPAVRAALPVVRDVRSLARAARPVGRRLAGVLDSFADNDGIERALDFLFYSATAVNGFDAFGHYLRASLIVNQCSTYAVAPAGGCSANFRRAAPATATATAARTRDPAPGAPDALARVLRGLGAGAGAPATPAPAADADAAPLMDYLFGGEG